MMLASEQFRLESIHLQLNVRMVAAILLLSIFGFLPDPASGDAHHVIEIYNRNHHVSKSIAEQSQPEPASTQHSKVYLLPNGQSPSIAANYRNQQQQPLTGSPQKPLKTGVQYVSENDILDAQQLRKKYSHSHKNPKAHSKKNPYQPEASKQQLVYKTGERSYGNGYVGRGAAAPYKPNPPYSRPMNLPVQTQYITVPTAPATHQQEVPLTIVAPAKPPIFAYKTNEGATAQPPPTIQLYSDYPRESQFQFGGPGSKYPRSNPTQINTYQWVPEVVPQQGLPPPPIAPHQLHHHPPVIHKQEVLYQVGPGLGPGPAPGPLPVGPPPPEVVEPEIDAVEFLPDDFFRSFFETPAHVPPHPPLPPPQVYHQHHHQQSYHSHYQHPPPQLPQAGVPLPLLPPKSAYIPIVAGPPGALPPHLLQEGPGGLLPTFILAEESKNPNPQLVRYSTKVRHLLPGQGGPSAQGSRLMYQPSGPRDEMKGEYSQNVESIQPSGGKAPTESYPLRVKKELVGKQNSEGKPWGEKTTLTYADPGDPHNFVQVQEYQMTLDRTLDPEQASNQFNHFLNKNKYNQPESGYLTTSGPAPAAHLLTPSGQPGPEPFDDKKKKK